MPNIVQEKNATEPWLSLALLRVLLNIPSDGRMEGQTNGSYPCVLQDIVPFGSTALLLPTEKYLVYQMRASAPLTNTLPGQALSSFIPVLVYNGTKMLMGAEFQPLLRNKS